MNNLTLVDKNIIGPIIITEQAIAAIIISIIENDEEVFGFSGGFISEIKHKINVNTVQGINISLNLEVSEVNVNIEGLKFRND